MTKRPTLLEFVEELERAEAYLSEVEHPLRKGFEASEVPASLVEMLHETELARLRAVVIGGVIYDLGTDAGWQAMADKMTTCFVCGRMRHECVCGR